MANKGIPGNIIIDESESNFTGAQTMNNSLKITGTGKPLEILQVKYLNNILQQDHLFIRKISKPILGFKAFHSASSTVAGIEVAHMMRTKQFANNNRSLFEAFAELAA
ncbi:IS6 family transposase [Brucella gallinifaecis]|uniref:IS6 family transposase n=1 Tax=Brucella gallinifaecis TaxID=215590 RepID=A0A502BM50_9HYPH|nr:IS6 family transposase [Brucella gallinifaecis]